jgi:hypothetical protein
MERMDPTGAPLTKSRESAGRLRPLSLVPLVLVLGQTAVAQISTDAGINQASALPDSLNPASGTALPAYSYGVDVGVGETDNVALTPTNRISQTMALTDADFSVNHQSRLFDVRAVGDFSYIDYLQGAFGPELLGRLDGTADAAIIPGRLTWTLKDDFGQSSVDPYTPTTPGNIESINYFTTGPELKLRFDSLDFIDVNVRYGRAQFQTSPFDSNRALGSVAVGRDVSAGGSLSLDATSERVMFADTAVNGDFSLSSVFGRYEFSGARTSLVGELGASKVDQAGAESSAALPIPITQPGSANGFSEAAPVQADPGGSLTAPLLKLQLTRRLSAASSLVFSGGQVLTDPASSFGAQGLGIAGISTAAPGYLSGGVYRDTYASAGWQFQRNRTSFGATGRWERDTYPGLPSLDTIMHGAQFYAQRNMSRAWTLQLSGNWNEYHYPYAALGRQIIGSTQYDNAIIGGGVIWHHGRGLEVRLRLDHDSYTVSNGNTGYRDNRAFLTIGYRPRNASPADQVF